MEQPTINQMNHLAEQYILTKNEQHFNELYELFQNEYKKTYPSVAVQVKNNDPSEVESVYRYTLFMVLRRYKLGTNFCSALFTSLKNARKNMARGERRRDRRRHKPKKDKEGNTVDPTSTLADSFRTEENVTENLTKKSHTEKKSLIDHFKNQTTDPTTVLILDEMPKHKNLNGVAKALGLQRNQVVRKLEKLKKDYDYESFGDPTAYFTT